MKTEQKPVSTSSTQASHFSEATETLLTPASLDVAKLQNVLGDMMSHKIDYADLYFQYSRSESWGLEEGQVKSGNFSIDQGVGVRAISGEKTAFAYSDDITFSALQEAAKATKDPNKVLEAMGMNPNDFYNWVIEKAKNPDKEVSTDPKEQAFNDKLSAYEKRVQETEAKLQSQSQQLEIDNTINNLVLPIVTKDQQAYETLFLLKKGNARQVAQYVFDTAAAIHQQTGELVPLDKVAAELEKYEWDKIEAGHNEVSKMNKFAAKYGSQSQQQPSATDKVDVRQPENRQQNNIVKQQPASQPVRSIFEPMSQDDRVAEALKRAGLAG